MAKSPEPRILAVLHEQGRKVVWLAAELEIKRPQLSYYIHGKRTPPPFFYERVSGILNVPVARVLPEPEEAAA